MADSSEDEALVAFVMLMQKKKKRNRTVWVQPWISDISVSTINLVSV